MLVFVEIFFFVPGLSEKYLSGGLLVPQRIARLLNSSPGFASRFVTTHEEHPGATIAATLFSKFKIQNSKFIHHSPFINSLFFVSWGPLVSQHIKLIRSCVPEARIVYYAQSFGWGVKVPSEIPIVCVSRHVMDKWKKSGVKNRLFVISPPLEPIFSFGEGLRDIDILAHARKQNTYCLKKLVPALDRMKGFTVRAIQDWISQKEFAGFLKRAKIFLYITAPHKSGFFRKSFAEGFGLPALEATACGALVGSNLLGGVTDFLVPGFNCMKLGDDLDADLRAIKHALENFRTNKTIAEKTAAEYSPKKVQRQWLDFLRTFGAPL